MIAILVRLTFLKFVTLIRYFCIIFGLLLHNVIVNMDEKSNLQEVEMNVKQCYLISPYFILIRCFQEAPKL
jgi:hypothetical protein